MLSLYWNNKRRDISRTLTEYALSKKIKSEPNNIHLLLACQPKTGSTFLAKVLAALPGMNEIPLLSECGRREQELEPTVMVLNHKVNYVAQHHVRYSEASRKLLATFEVKPIVQVRNIFDAVISLRDHFRNESVDGSMGYACPYMLEWPDEKLEEFIVDMFVPWYFNFYMTWQDCENICLVTYEELITDSIGVVARINHHYSLGFEDVDIEAAVTIAQTKPTRKNSAVSGRGSKLNKTCKEKIKLMASYYDGIDFTPMGIS